MTVLFNTGTNKHEWTSARALLYLTTVFFVHWVAVYHLKAGSGFSMVNFAPVQPQPVTCASNVSQVMSQNWMKVKWNWNESSEKPKEVCVFCRMSPGQRAGMCHRVERGSTTFSVWEARTGAGELTWLFLYNSLTAVLITLLTHSVVREQGIRGHSA